METGMQREGTRPQLVDSCGEYPLLSENAQYSTNRKMPKDEDELPPDEVINWIADVGVNPYKRSPEQGIADMKSHLQVLQSDLAFWIEEGHTEMQTEVRRQIRDCEVRLAEYQVQLKGRN